MSNWRDISNGVTLSGYWKGGGSQSTNTIQNSDPWSGQQGYLQDVFAKAKGLNNGAGPQYYQGNTVAGQSQATQQALQMTQDRALSGSPMLNDAKSLNQSMINGDYLNNNPWLDKTYDQAANAVTRNYREGIAPSIDSQFSNSGRYGSNSYNNAKDQAQDNLGSSLNNLATDIYGGNYANERSNQNTAMGYASQLADGDYNDAAKLAAVGEARDGYSQDQLNANIAKWDYLQNAPMQNLSNYNQIVNGGSYGGQTSTTASGGSAKSNKLSGALGGAATGFAVGGPWGAAAGGLLGLLG